MNQIRARFDRDFLADLAWLQCEVRAEILLSHQRYVFFCLGAKAFLFHPDAINARDDLDDVVDASAIGCRRNRHAGRGVGRRDGGSGYNRALRVRNRACNVSAAGLGE